MNSFPSMQQPDGSPFCGAYCVVATLYAFDKLPFTAPLSLNRYDAQQKSFTGPKLDIVDSSNLVELALEFYKVTGILTPGPNPSYVDGAGNNSLGAMLSILNQCDLKTEVVFKNEETLDQIRSVFPIEIELIEKLGVPISLLDNNDSTPSDSVLISVIAYPELHYVVNNHQGEWFDSDLEAHLFHWDKIESWDESNNKREGASWLGVSIQVCR
ncbi:hypothetical protein [Vibrio penaeicida]|uniref:Peptidase C39-like domain-containing protein n=1 Tax=Vibrio penaeicida TaxID=104609 RepID=A0AAV5NUJ8_9VIBR|nr:hypothetical protein [Vibrio penaeicida]RTZ22320.1 hypothetical protein EKN09_14755 [Vibrio penaeicida]GLQ74275.1 hypothetical protein GCM10007932_36360 [Vibrio penaeicida]